MKRQQSISARGRRALGWGLALFTAGQIALGLVIEDNYPELIDPEEGRRFQLLRARQAETPGRPLVLVLGSSRTAMGLRPEALPTFPTEAARTPLVFNYSLVGSGPLTELLVMERLAGRGIRPDAVLLEVSANGMEQEVDLPMRLDRGVLPSDLRLVARYSRRPWPDYWRCLEGSLWPAYVHRSPLQREWLCLAGPADPEDVYWSTLDHLGWLPCPWNLRADGKYKAYAVRQRARRGPSFERFQPAPAVDRALRELLSQCRRCGIKAGLLVTPEASDIRRGYTPSALAEWRSYLSTLCAEFQVPCIDARTWIPDEEFADGIHLAPAGATHFSERFGKEFLVPWLSGSTPSSFAPREVRPCPEIRRETGFGKRGKLVGQDRAGR
jgi:hypothetical protein